MNSAPWWFVLVTALLTGGFTLSGSLLTGRGALKVKREELSHQRALEREKQLYDRRIELYTEILPLVEQTMNSLEGYDRSASDQNSTIPEAFRMAYGHIESEIQRLRDLTDQVTIIGGKDVRAMMRQFTQDAAITLARLRRGERLEDINNSTEVEFAAKHLVFEIRVEIGTISRDDYDDEIG